MMSERETTGNRRNEVKDEVKMLNNSFAENEIAKMEQKTKNK